jgi:hypothetical protein
MSDSRQTTLELQYAFHLPDGRELMHTVHISSGPTVLPEDLPDWSRLDFHQCQHCPLAADSSPYCPFAAALRQPVSLLSDIASFEEVTAVVTWRGREIRQATTMQRAAGALLGAVSATSGCPHTLPLKAMAWFHWPFSTSDETTYRSLGTYLLAQHLRRQHGLTPDWDLEGLRATYRHLRQVNLGMANRLRAAADRDSSVNAIILLDLLAADTLYSIDQYEGELDVFFREHLS